MANFIPFNRDQAFLRPPDLKSWLPDDDLAHFVVAAVERVHLAAFEVPGRTGGKRACQTACSCPGWWLAPHYVLSEGCAGSASVEPLT
jgi:hypothetical protein